MKNGSLKSNTNKLRGWKKLQYKFINYISNFLENKKHIISGKKYVKIKLIIIEKNVPIQGLMFDTVKCLVSFQRKKKRKLRILNKDLK